MVSRRNLIVAAASGIGTFWALFTGRAQATQNGDIRHIEPGPQASQAVIHNGLVEIVGVIDGDGTKSAYEQTKTILARIDDLLDQAGTDKSRLLRGWVIATTHDNRHEADEAWMEWLDGLNTPARVSMIAGLGWPQFKVEITVTAAL